MKKSAFSGIGDRVTFHNPENGWVILRVSPFNYSLQQERVIVHQTKVFAGATTEFKGSLTYHKQYGRRFPAKEAVGEKTVTTAALEKYLGRV